MKKEIEKEMAGVIEKWWKIWNNNNDMLPPDQLLENLHNLLVSVLGRELDL